jgi:hypothetical protein
MQSWITWLDCRFNTHSPLAVFRPPSGQQIVSSPWMSGTVYADALFDLK